MYRFLAILTIVGLVGLLCNVSAKEPKLRRLTTMELQGETLVRNDSMRTVELLGQKRSGFGTFQSIRLYDIISSLPEITTANRASLVVVCESSGGQTCAVSFSEIDPAVVKLPPLLLISLNAESGSRLDSFSLADKRNAKGEVDLSALESRFSKVTRLRYIMNDLEMGADERRQFKNSSMRLLFPYDRTTSRWLGDVRFIHVYVVE